jgi:hypothetical protein
VTQGGLIDEKTEGRKSRATVPLKTLMIIKGFFKAKSNEIVIFNLQIFVRKILGFL